MICEYYLRFCDSVLIRAAIFILWTFRGIPSSTGRQKDSPTIYDGAVERVLAILDMTNILCNQTTWKIRVSLHLSYFPCLVAFARQYQLQSLPLLRARRAWRSFLFTSWTLPGEVLILRIQSSWQVTHVATRRNAWLLTRSCKGCWAAVVIS